MTLFALWAIVLLAALASIGCACFSIWFDKRYPATSEKQAQEDAENLLKRANKEAATRPQFRAGSPL